MKNLSRRAFIGIGAATGMSVALAGCSAKQEEPKAAEEAQKEAPALVDETTHRIVTGGESGTYYAMATVIGQHAINNAGVKVTALTSAGSQANIFEIEDGNAELAFCQSDIMAQAYQGTNMFEGTPIDCFSTLGALYVEPIQIVTCDPEIKTIPDLAGKRVSIGASGGGANYNTADVLAAYDMTLEDIDPRYLSYDDAADALMNDQIDAALLTASAPAAAITDLDTYKPVYMVTIDDEHIEKLIETNDYYARTTIPAKTYSGVESEVGTIAVIAVMIAADSVSEEAAYALTADVFDNAHKLVDSHAKFADIHLELGASIASVPYHPGAARYFTDHGFEVNTK